MNQNNTIDIFTAVRTPNPRKMRQIGDAVCVWEIRTAYKIFIEKISREEMV
jgi:hypothetical protein